MFEWKSLPEPRSLRPTAPTPTTRLLTIYRASLLIRSIARRWRVGQATPSSSLAIITPGLLGPDYFREVAGVLKSTPPGTPPNAAAIGEIMRRSGLTRAP